MSYLVCINCKGYYKLKKGESMEDFKSCGCGGKLKQYGSLYEFLDEHYGLNYSEIIKENKQLKDEHSQLKETYKILNDEYLNQVSEHNGLKMANANFESEKIRLKESYDDLKIKYDQLNKDYLKQDSDSNNLKNINTDFETENIKLKELYDSLKLENDSLNDDYKNLKEELDGLKKENQILQDNQASHYFELEALKKHNEKAFNKNEELKDNLNKLKYVLSKNSRLEDESLNNDSKSDEVEKLEELKREEPKISENMSYEELNAAYNLLLEMFTELTEENSKLKELNKNENLDQVVIPDEGIETGK